MEASHARECAPLPHHCDSPRLRVVVVVTERNDERALVQPDARCAGDRTHAVQRVGTSLYRVLSMMVL